MICENDSKSTCILSDILSEVKDMEALLDSLSSGTKDLIGSNNNQSKSTVKRVLSTEEKRQAAKSAWARSKTPVAKSIGPKASVNIVEEDKLNVLVAEKAVRVKAPSFSFGNPSKASRSPELLGGNKDNVPGPVSYDVNEDMLSNRKRPQAPSFPKCKRPSHPVDVAPANDGPNKEQASSYVSSKPSKGVSFGKASRFTVETKKRPATEPAGPPQSQLEVDLSKVDKYQQPHIPTAIMVPPAQVKKLKKPDHEVQESPPLPPTPITEKTYEVLSNRYKSPAITFNPPTKPVNKVELTKHPDLGIPGPGHYEVNEEVLRQVVKGAGVQKGVKFQPIKQPGEVFDNEEKNRNLIRRKEEERLLVESRGPGVYHTVTPTKVVVPRFQNPKVTTESEAKVQVRLERKRYFEQKAADMREVHDELRVADDSVLHKRVPTVSFGAPSKSALVGKGPDEYSFKAEGDHSEDRSERIKLLHDIDKLIDEENHQRDYDVKYNQVEKRSIGMVTMKAEVSARESTQNRFKNKPEALKVLVNKSEGIAAQKKFYGPQLPVPWVPEKEALTSYHKRRRDGDSDSDSPTSEILELLQAADQRDNQHIMNDELTEAYLRSSYSGSQFKKKPSINFHTNPQDSERTAFHRKVDPDALELDFVGPQLQEDWGEKIKRKPHHSIDLNKLRGREKVKFHGKGMLEIQDFDDHHVVKDESNLAPGVYDVMSNIEIAKQSVKGISFSRQVAREDMVGAFGEKPQSAVGGVDGVDGDVMLNREKVLDIDYGLAKDQAFKKKQKDIVLYRKDRDFGEKKKKDDPGIDHLGGSWFEGMFEEMQKKEGKSLQFSKMAGRPGGNEEGGLDEAEIMNDILGPQEDGLDLDVQDWHPNRPVPKAKAFNDPKKYPRFPVEKKDEKPIDAPPTPDVKYSQIHEKSHAGVNMGKMRGREDEIDKEQESKGIDALVYGEIDDHGAVGLAEERAKAISQGKDSMMRRGPNFVSFGKQRGRSDLEDKRETGENLINQEIGDEGKLFTRIPDEDHDRNKIGQSGKGALGWDKQIGRQDDDSAVVKDGETGAGDAWMFEKAELDIKPTKEGTSKQRRMQSVPAWNTQTDRFAADNDVVEAVIGMQVKDGERLQLNDVDRGNVKPGMHDFGAKAQRNKGYNMGNQIGRQAESDIYLGISQELGVAEHAEVIIDPTDETLVRKPKGGAALKSSVSRFVPTEKEELLTAEERQYAKNQKDVLDIRPSDKGLQRHQPSATAMASKQSRFAVAAKAEEESIMKSLNVEKEELRLEPTDTAVRRSTNVEGAISMRQSASRIPTLQEEKILQEEERLTKEVLDIRTFDNDTAMKNRITGGSTMKSSSERIPSMKELQVAEEIRKSTQQELILDTEVRSSRVKLANASSLANKEERSMNKKDSGKSIPGNGKNLRKSSTSSTIQENKKPTSNLNSGKPAQRQSADNMKPSQSTVSPVNVRAPMPTGKIPELESYNVDKLNKQLAELGL